jgi:hypothetical protein
MKHLFFRITIMWALAFIAATQNLRAQEPLLANIPFAFTAGEMALPAGEYRVEKPASGSLMLLIQRTDRSAAAFVRSIAAQENGPQTQSKLVFHRHGQRYFLSKVWIAGYSQGRELPQTKQEKELALASNKTAEQVTIVARLVTPKP